MNLTATIERIREPEGLTVFPAAMLGGIDPKVLRAMGVAGSIAGAMPRGIHAAGDILTSTGDGVDLNRLWNDFQASLAIQNERRDSLVQLLTYPTTLANESVFQSGAQAEFEESTEYGLPVGYRPALAYATMGYDFKWRDLGGYYTWQFLAEAPASQVQAFNNMAIEADNRTIFNKVMNTLFNNTRRTNKEGNVVYPFYNGQSVDAFDTPPPYGATVHAAGHNHFLTVGATLEPTDVEGMQDHLTHHGFTKDRGNTLVLMVNQAQGDVMRNWRSTANGGTGRYDFIPSSNTPSFLLPVNVRTEGGAPPSTYQGFNVIGAYGQFIVLQDDYVPASYLVAFATGGQDALPNPIAFREHTNASLRGMRLVKGRTPDYPLIDSVYNRGFGTGVRYRGAAVIAQVTAGAYSIPTQYV
jgi:hypothetical protein